MHNIQLACPDYKELGKDKGKISEFLPWRDMEETPGKIPEEYPCCWSLFLFRIFCWRGGENMYPELHHLYTELSPCPAPVQSMWEVSPLQTNPPSKHHPTWEAQCGGRHVYRLRDTSSRQPCVAWAAFEEQKYSLHTCREGMDSTGVVVLTAPTHTVVVTAVHISSQDSNNLTCFQVWVPNLTLLSQC